MQILKWVCFIFLCGDALAYIVNQARNNLDSYAKLLGLAVGTAMRVFVLYGTLTCWLLT